MDIDPDPILVLCVALWALVMVVAASLGWLAPLAAAIPADPTLPDTVDTTLDEETS